MLQSLQGVQSTWDQLWEINFCICRHCSITNQTTCHHLTYVWPIFYIIIYVFQYLSFVSGHISLIMLAALSPKFS